MVYFGFSFLFLGDSGFGNPIATLFSGSHFTIYFSAWGRGGKGGNSLSNIRITYSIGNVRATNNINSDIPYSNRSEFYNAAILSILSKLSSSFSESPSPWSLSSLKSYVLNLSIFLISFLLRLGNAVSILLLVLKSINSPKNFCKYRSISYFLFYPGATPSSLDPISKEIRAKSNYNSWKEI